MIFPQSKKKNFFPSSLLLFWFACVHRMRYIYSCLFAMAWNEAFLSSFWKCTVKVFRNDFSSVFLLVIHWSCLGITSMVLRVVWFVIFVTLKTGKIDVINEQPHNVGVWNLECLPFLPSSYYSSQKNLSNIHSYHWRHQNGNC